MSSALIQSIEESFVMTMAEVISYENSYKGHDTIPLMTMAVVMLYEAVITTASPNAVHIEANLGHYFYRC